MTSLVLLAVLAQAEPRYAGGAAPHPMNSVGPADPRPSAIACSTETLRARSACVLDGRPMWATDKGQQLLDNRRIAASVGESLCREGAEALAAEARDRGERLKSCLTRVQQAAKSCELDGVEALLDAAGLFSSRAGVCYAELAGAAQLLAVPAVSPEPPPARSTVHGAGGEVRL